MIELGVGGNEEKLVIRAALSLASGFLGFLAKTKFQRDLYLELRYRKLEILTAAYVQPYP